MQWGVVFDPRVAPPPQQRHDEEGASGDDEFDDDDWKVLRLWVESEEVMDDLLAQIDFSV